MASSSLTDRATMIAAGLCANSGIVKAVDLTDPTALALHAVRIARAVRDASEVRPKREKSKESKSKQAKSKREAVPPNGVE